MTRGRGNATAAAAAALIIASSACSSHERPSLIGDADGGSRVVAPRAGCVTDPHEAPAPDAEGLCGNHFLDAAGKPPNLYFIIDRSGSMQSSVDGRQKYAAVADAAVKLVRSLGAHANVGAAVFPRGPTDDTCAAGEEVFPPTLGDVGPRAACEGDGPVTRAFSRSISLPARVDPRGSTPTAATLTALTPRLAALPGTTAVILATDGGPNCNPAAACTEAACIPNIEGDCPADVNCCADAAYGPRACLDAEPTRAAVQALREQGIKTYVVGVPGSGPYRTLLDELAMAGGAARVNGQRYYEVERIAELDGILGAIGREVTVSCDLVLAETPPAPWLVNVYLDRRLVPYGSADGWQWTSDGVGATPDDSGVSPAASDAATYGGEAGVVAGFSDAHDDLPSARRQFRLLGAACADLESGRARQMQVTFGCPTAVIN